MHCNPKRAVALAVALAMALPGHAQADDLTRLSLEQLLDVKVVGASKYEQRQREVAASVSVITRQEIKAFGWRTLDQALASLPGVHFAYDRQYVYLGTRGFGLPGDYNTRVLVTVNGNRLNDPIFDGGPFGRQLPLDLGLVERIEFIPGPGGAVYGQNAMFGVVNIVTLQGRDVDGVDLALAYQRPQSLREGRATWGRRLEGGVDALVSVSGLRSRGEDRLFDFGAAGVSGVAAGLDGERDQELFARLARGPWSADLVYGRQRKDDPTGAFLSDPLVPGQYQGDGYTVVQAQYQDDLADGRYNLLARLFKGRQEYRSRLVYGTPFSFPATGDWHGGELRLLSRALERHKLMVGLEAQDNTRQDQSILDLNDPANDIVIRGSGYRIGVYAQDEWRATETLIATFGLRVDRNDATGTKTSPRAALIWLASDATTLKALFGRAHRAPNAYERDYDDGFAQVANPSLRGERIDTLELVADHRVGSDLALRASLYQWTLHDLITLGLDPVSGIPQYQTGEDAKAHGVELSADKTWAGGARLRGSISWQHLGYDSGRDFINAPKLLGKVNASMPLPWAGLRLGYEWRYDASRLTLNGVRLGGYAVSNLHLSTGALAPGLDLALTVRNLFDKRYEHPGADSNWQNAFEQDGRSFNVRLEYRF